MTTGDGGGFGPGEYGIGDAVRRDGCIVMVHMGHGHGHGPLQCVEETGRDGGGVEGVYGA